MPGAPAHAKTSTPRFTRRPVTISWYLKGCLIAAAMQRSPLIKKGDMDESKPAVDKATW